MPYQTQALARRLVERILEAAREDYWKQQFPQFTGDQIKEIASADPAGGKYTTWLLRMTKAGHLRFPEDQEKVLADLKQFQLLSRKPGFKGEQDLNRYKDYESLANAIDANSKVKTKGEQVRAEIEDGVQLLAQEGELKLFMVTTAKAAAKLFRNTRWCVKDPKYFNQYEPKQFFYFEKDGTPEALLHLISGQFKNRNDGNIKDSTPFLGLLRTGGVEKLALQDAQHAYQYAKNVIQSSWPLGEEIIAQDAYYAYRYARSIIQGRWPPGEEAIAKDTLYAYNYATDVIKDPWPPGEKAIAQDAEYSYLYARDVVQGRWPPGEEAIAQHASHSYFYAHKNVQGPWPPGEKAIAQDAKYSYLYARNVVQGRWPPGETAIAQDAMTAYDYAANVVKGRFPKGEKAIRKNQIASSAYSVFMKKLGIELGADF